MLVGQSAVITNLTGDPGAGPPTPPLSLLAGGFSGFTLTNNSTRSPPPNITCSSNRTVQCGSAWAFDDPTAVDGCTGGSLPVYVLSTFTNGLCPQLVTRTWAATNSCDTSYATCSQEVTVVNTSAPTLICAADKTVNCETNWTYDTPSGFDPCTGTSLPVSVLGTVSTNARNLHAVLHPNLGRHQHLQYQYGNLQPDRYRRLLQLPGHRRHQTVSASSCAARWNTDLYRHCHQHRQCHVD